MKGLKRLFTKERRNANDAKTYFEMFILTGCFFKKMHFKQQWDTLKWVLIREKNKGTRYCWIMVSKRETGHLRATLLPEEIDRDCLQEQPHGHRHLSLTLCFSSSTSGKIFNGYIMEIFNGSIIHYICSDGSVGVVPNWELFCPPKRYLALSGKFWLSQFVGRECYCLQWMGVHPAKSRKTSKELRMIQSRGFIGPEDEKSWYTWIYVLSHFSCVQLFVILRIVAHQALLSMGFSRQEYWSGLPFPSPST